jgi:hypothetical protein
MANKDKILATGPMKKRHDVVYWESAQVRSDDTGQEISALILRTRRWKSSLLKALS